MAGARRARGYCSTGSSSSTPAFSPWAAGRNPDGYTSDNGRVGPDQVFCLASGELPGQFVPATVPSAAGPVPDDSACAAHAAAFASVPAFSETDGPRTLFEVSVRDEPSLEPGP